MTDLFIKSSKAIVKLVSDKEIIDDIKHDEFLESYIPSVEILDKGKQDKTIIVKKGSINKVNISLNTITYLTKKINTKDIIAFMEYVLERIRQEKGVICIHGAGAVVNDKVVITWGTTTGMGKTTLALELAKDNMFYSDEKILIDLIRMKAVGRIKNQYLSNSYWKEKYGKDNYFCHDNTSTDKEYDIALFVEPIICDQKDYVLDKWSSEKFLWHLYEESSRKIRGTSRILFDNTYPIMSFDNEILATNRLNLLKKFTKKINAIYYKGNIKNALEIINDLIK